MRKMRESVRILLIRRTWWTAAACLCLAAVMFYVVNYPAAIGAAAAARQLPIYCVQRDQKLVSISFDAAWGDVRQRRRSSDVRTQLRGECLFGTPPSACQKSPPARSFVIRR